MSNSKIWFEYGKKQDALSSLWEGEKQDALFLHREEMFNN